MSKTAYVLGKRIARGGMAEIFLGKAVGEDQFQRICAIKRILPHYAQDKEFVEMFRDEAHICKRLQHANIVQVYDFTEVDGSYALIMEHVDGADLRTLLSACESNRVRLSVAAACYIIACAARGLHYAHTKTDEITGQQLGIIHRDVSPQNILLSYEGEIKITDFGIASAESKMNETRPGVVKGKYSYMSPEQVMAKQVDPRTDVFALAIVLWECLAMKRLFTGSTEVETIRKVQNCEIPLKLTDLNPSVDNDLMNIVLKGLQKDPKKRYATAAAFEKELLRYQHSKFPDFVPGDVGDFLKKVLASRRDKSQDEIKQTLTQTDLRKSSKEQTKDAPRGADKKEDEAATPADKEASSASLRKVELKYDPSDYRKEITVNPSAAHKASNVSTPLPRQPSTPPRRSSSAPRVSPQPRVVRAQRSSRSLAVPLAMLLMLMGGYFLLADKTPSGDGRLKVELKTIPLNVALTIDGKKMKGGQYIRTPMTLELAPGKHQMQIERPGFLMETVTFQGNQNDVLKPAPIQLKRDPNSLLVNLKVVSPGKKLMVNFDNGLAKGTTPLLIKDIKTDLPHNLSFAPVDGGDRRTLRCQFKVPDRDQNFVIEIQTGRDGKGRCIGRSQ